MKKILSAICVALLIAVALNGTAVAAKEWPNKKAIKLVVNFSAGGVTDLIARLMAKVLEKELGQSVVVVNETGGGGTVGVASVARAKPDGYTIGTCNMPTLAIIPKLRKVPYNPIKDFTQVCVVMPYEYAIIVNGDSPWKTWDEFVAYVKAHPGEVTYGSLGTGTTNHLTMARIGKELGFDWKHVPFKGGVKQVAALLGGHVDAQNVAMGEVVSSIKAGKLRAILVTSQHRYKPIPDVPTIEEKGFSFFQGSYMSIIAPAGLPANIRSRLEAAFKVACSDKEILERAEKLYLFPQFMPGQEYDKLLKKLSVQWGEVLADLGLIPGK